jgi:hypothetical protein
MAKFADGYRSLVSQGKAAESNRIHQKEFIGEG